MTRPRPQKLFTLSLVFLVNACASAAQPGSLASPQPAVTAVSTPAATVNPASGQFVFALGDGSLQMRDSATLQAKTLLQASGKEIHDSPSFSPDGLQIVFVAHVLEPGAQSNDIRAINTDGTNVRSLFKPPVTNPPRIFPGYPRYSPDATAIYFSLITSGPNPQDQKYQIARGPAAGGDWKVVVENGYMPTLSKDGAQLAFARINPQTFMSSLWLANADGSNAVQLLADDVFLGVRGMRFSPDGKWLAFAASGPPQKKLPGAQLPLASDQTDNCAVGFWLVCFATRAQANGLPWEIWLVSADGKNFKQLTKLALDIPWPAFSKDGRYIAMLDLKGLFRYDRETNQVTTLINQGEHSVLDWFQQ